MKTLFSAIIFLLLFHSSFSQGLSRDSIISKYLRHGAWKYSYMSRQWDSCIAAGIGEDSTVAYLWQQRAMPLFKKRKYEAGMAYVDKAVQYDSTWQDYRAFIKCIFAKTYKDALQDFQDCKRKGLGVYVMDHSYDFYIALCYLQLNQYEQALSILKKDIDYVTAHRSEDAVSHLDVFYLGVIYYELRQFDNAIAAFDRALRKYPNFSDAKYYKALCLLEQGAKEKALVLIKEAKADHDNGYTINEDSSFYEPYPYQVNWYLVHL